MIDAVQFSAWFKAHAAALTLFARQIVDSPDLADDAVHEAFVALLSQSQPPADVRAWLFKTVRNQAISQMRSNWRRRNRERAVMRPDWFEPRADDLIDARSAEQALAGLPKDQREMVVLRIWGQMSFAQIAEVTGAKLPTVFHRYQSALAAMRKKLESSRCNMTKTNSKEH